MIIEEKYLKKINKFNIDKIIIFNNTENLYKINNNHELFILYNIITKNIKKIEKYEDKYKKKYTEFNNKLSKYKLIDKIKFKKKIKSKKFNSREKLFDIIYDNKKEVIEDIQNFYRLFIKI